MVYAARYVARGNLSSGDLETETNSSGPVLIGFKNPGHRVMLDGVRTNPDGSKTYLVRDPDAATVARLAELQREFPDTEIKALACPTEMR